MTAPRRADQPAITLFGRAIGHLRRIARALPGGGTTPYLDRYSARPQGKSGTNEWRAYLHHFLSPDDEGHHNHPFVWSVSLVLRGSYTEEVLDQHDRRIVAWNPGFRVVTAPAIRTRRVRWFNWIAADKYHRIVALHPSPGDRGVWTLFFAGPLARNDSGAPRGWGFWIPGRGHVPWEVRFAERADADRSHN